MEWERGKEGREGEKESGGEEGMRREGKEERGWWLRGG